MERTRRFWGGDGSCLSSSLIIQQRSSFSEGFGRGYEFSLSPFPSVPCSTPAVQGSDGSASTTWP